MPATNFEILVKGLPSGYEVEHLARVFVPGAKPRAAGGGTRGALLYARAGKGRLAAGWRSPTGSCRVRTAPTPGNPADVKLALCRLLYDLLCEAQDIRPPWGLLTGVRPVNHLRKRLAQGGETAAREYLVDRCDVSEEKYTLARNIVETQRPVLQACGPRSYSLYVGIPFCPSRCAYCSFVSQSTERESHLIAPYLDALCRELEETAALADTQGLRLETVYVGGGTPTALDVHGLDRLLGTLARLFSPQQTAEYTVEAGRPDCTDADKLRLMRAYGVNRVSVNPQSLNDAVLKAIGRRHTAGDVLRCVRDTREAGFDHLNMDLIAGLPTDSETSFAATLNTVLALRPESVTLHSLTLKRASNLVAQGPANIASPLAMLSEAAPALTRAGYHPYYLYRQKSGVENLENTGWCAPGKEGLYNIYIMEEAHTILACGAGASTKLVAHPGSDARRIKRIYNHKLPIEYIRHLDAILRRKREGVNAFYAGYLDTKASG